jgi:epoxyqueuosine reductase
MKLLLHICCAPCSAACIKVLREENIDIVGYWYNPNIHPFKEYDNRLKALKEYSKMINLNVIYDDFYGLDNFVRNTINIINNRCGYCYLSRMEKVVKYAHDNGYDAFSSTLFISPYQKHDLLKDICEKLSKKYNIQFLYRDFRPYYELGREMFRETGLYMQKYCGCIFSERERYKKEIDSSKIKSDKLNIETLEKIKLSWNIPGLSIKKSNGSNELLDMILNLKFKDSVHKLYEKYIHNNLKSIKCIYIYDELIGFYDKNYDIYLKSEYLNMGIEEEIKNH